MKLDSYFQKGYGHDVCQDFSCVQNTNVIGGVDIGYGLSIVSDGCSMSHKYFKEVDFGARVLAYASRWISLEASFHYHDMIDNFNLYRECIANKTVDLLNKSKISFGVSEYFADATLLMAFGYAKDNKNKAKVFAWGDGNIFIKYKDGTKEIVNINFTSGAPYYLSYFMNEKRRKSYESEYGTFPVYINRYIIENEELEDINVETISILDDDYESKMIFSFDDVEYVSVCSDGFSTFYGDNDSEPLWKVLMRYNTIKNENGEFVERRMKSQDKFNEKNGIKYYDDISIASIIF